QHTIHQSLSQRLDQAWPNSICPICNCRTRWTNVSMTLRLTLNLTDCFRCPLMSFGTTLVSSTFLVCFVRLFFGIFLFLNMRLARYLTGGAPGGVSRSS